MKICFRIIHHQVHLFTLLESNYIHTGNEINLSNHYPELFKKKLPYIISLAKKWL